MISERTRKISRIVFLLSLGVVSTGTALAVAPNIFHLPEARPGCDEPISWSLGEVDPRFPVDRRKFLKTAFEAETIWERAIGHPLFIYDPSAPFVVTTVFDDRQKMTYETRDLERTISGYQQRADILKGTYDDLRSGFERDQAALTRHVDSFQKKLAAYNADVSRANASGGASRDQYSALEKRRKDLADEQKAIDAESQKVNAEAAKVNATAGRFNSEADTVRNNLSDYRKKYGEPKPFIEGLYESPLKSITIYQFEGTDDLRLVLAHEFGHALGIDDHVENDRGAVMYAMMGGQNLAYPALTQGDFQAYATACPPIADSPRDAFVRYLVTTPWSKMNFWDLLATLYR